MSTTEALRDLLERLTAAEGHDVRLDRAIAETLDPRPAATEAPEPDYTASVDRCLDLLHRVLPGWHWHVGFGATGLLPYGFVSGAGGRFEPTAPTVPLALLVAIVQGRLFLAERRGEAG
jgi:hypothetical protein